MSTACVILAAGLGKRMRSSLPKVLHPLGGAPMLQSVIDSVRKIRPRKIVVVAGVHLHRIEEAVGAPDIVFALQKEPKGTGHALQSAVPSLKGFDGDILIINGDTPLIRPATLRRLLGMHKKNRNDVSVLSFVAKNPAAYGRVVRDRAGKVLSIVEEKDADLGQKAITEVNSGVYALRSTALKLLGRIPENPIKKEYYLTDIISLASQQGLKASAYCIGEEEEFMGINTRPELDRAADLMRKNIIEDLRDRGVLFVDPGAVYLDRTVKIGSGTVLYPNVCIEGTTKIGKDSVVYPNTRIKNSLIGNRVLIRDSTVIEDSTVRDKASVGPFAHVRPGSVVGPEARIGNFVELKKAVVGKGSKASHLSYLGDALIGSRVNIGAGTITCNYDGVHKHQTVIEDGVFIGSDSQLVAPVRISAGAYIGAGSTITRDVPPDSLAVSRSEQKVYKNWAKKRRAGK
ncbi:MAG: UDP-N-acetylglucosamine diphosphorylase/glucosamine-1-phosphate N-acetyltransferase [Nitrospirae bacterium]|nr:MAG: UDP-N-acetylglucosamine diphosphorylase/glucosamine-1-phosphate N-acetyltransferase [Nitrospirota bacterium]